MPATLSQITRWVGKAQDQGATHMIVKCDDFDYHGGRGDSCCYPVEVMSGQDVREVAAKNGDRTMEVYSFTGKHSVEDQLRERFALHFD